MQKILIFLATFLILSSCKNDKSTVATIDTTGKQNKKEYQNFGVPGIPKDLLLSFFTEVSHVDYIFYDLPFSLSQDNTTSIQSNINLISPEPLGDDILKGCKPIGREFFQIGDNVEYEADLYFSEGCHGYVFMKDGKPLYANKLSGPGLKFYTNIINRAMNMQKKVTNGPQ